MHRYGESRTTRARITVILVLRRSHRLKAASHRHSVTVITPRRDPIATGDRIPRNFRPLDLGCAHAGDPIRLVVQTDVLAAGNISPRNGESDATRGVDRRRGSWRVFGSRKEALHEPAVGFQPHPQS